MASEDSDSKESQPKNQFAFVWLFPSIVGKGLILFFGTYYAAYPGQGYGYGLAIAMAFTVVMLARFAWSNRNYQD